MEWLNYHHLFYFWNVAKDFPRFGSGDGVGRTEKHKQRILRFGLRVPQVPIPCMRMLGAAGLINKFWQSFRFFPLVSHFLASILQRGEDCFCCEIRRKTSVHRKAYIAGKKHVRDAFAKNGGFGPVFALMLCPVSHFVSLRESTI